MVIGPDKGDNFHCDAQSSAARPAVMCSFRFTRSAWNIVLPRPMRWWHGMLPECQAYTVVGTSAPLWFFLRQCANFGDRGAQQRAWPSRCRSREHIVAVSRRSVERWRKIALNEGIERKRCFHRLCAMVTVEKEFMQHGCENVPDYMISGSREDLLRRRRPFTSSADGCSTVLAGL